MKRAADVLSSIFDESFVKKATGYSKFFASWEDITAKNGMPAAAAHSRIKKLDKGIVVIEMDHPGWKQILQTKQSKFLHDFRFRFPDLQISGLSLVLGNSGNNRSAENSQNTQDSEETQEQLQEKSQKQTMEKTKLQESNDTPELQKPHTDANQSDCINYDAIQNTELREKLIKLGKAIAEKEKKP